jgi:methyl acetate hydrolase
VESQHARIADAKALAVYDAFERGAYQLVNAERKRSCNIRPA